MIQAQKAKEEALKTINDHKDLVSKMNQNIESLLAKVRLLFYCWDLWTMLSLRFKI